MSDNNLFKCENEKKSHKIPLIQVGLFVESCGDTKSLETKITYRKVKRSKVHKYFDNQSLLFTFGKLCIANRRYIILSNI